MCAFIVYHIYLYNIYNYEFIQKWMYLQLLLIYLKMYYIYYINL